jgi:2-methylcitrate dehydratase
MAGFLGPRDIFRNPEAIFRIFEGPGQMFQKVGATSANTEKKDASPFDLVLARAGDDFAVMGMHFKLGLYEHQSAGALQAMHQPDRKPPHLLDDQPGVDCIKIKIVAYEPAFGIIGDPAKRDPKTRQSRTTRWCTSWHAAAQGARAPPRRRAKLGWKELMLAPHDFDPRRRSRPADAFAHVQDDVRARRRRSTTPSIPTA